MCVMLLCVLHCDNNNKKQVGWGVIMMCVMLLCVLHCDNNNNKSGGGVGVGGGGCFQCRL